MEENKEKQYKTPKYIRDSIKRYYDKNKNDPEFMAHRYEIMKKNLKLRKIKQKQEKEELKKKYLEALEQATQLLTLLETDD